MFVETKKRPPYHSNLRLWKREFGALWVPFEREKIIEFSRVKANERITISGYVKWINNKSFALVPTLFSNQIHLLCVNNTERRPTENSYITVSGTTAGGEVAPKPRNSFWRWLLISVRSAVRRTFIPSALSVIPHLLFISLSTFPAP